MTPQEYINRIKPLRNPEEIQQVCQELADSLFGNREYADKTRANKLTPYNKLINQIPNEELIEGENAYIYTKEDGTLWKRHLHHKFLGLSKEQWKEINAKTIVLDRLENRRKVDVRQYLEITLKLLQSNDPHELAVGLIAASGRRPVEILVRGSFTITKELPEYLKHSYFVNFKGQAKKRDYDMPEEERAEYRIGLLVPAQFFLESFARFRKMPEARELLSFVKTETKKGTSPEEINDAIESRRGNSLRRIVRRDFGSFLPTRFNEKELDNKTLRAVYVRLITERDCPKSIDGLLWASRAVGHFVDNEKPSDSQLRHLTTTLGYSDYYCDTTVPFVEAPATPEKQKTKSMTIYTADYEDIKQLQDKWDLISHAETVRYLLSRISQVESLERQLVEKDTEIQNLITQNNQLREELTLLIEDVETQIQVIKQEELQLEPEVESQPEPQQPQEQDLEAMIQRLVADALNKALSKPEPQPVPVPVVEVQQPVKSTAFKPIAAKPERQERDWTLATAEELKASKAKGAVDEKLFRAFQAVCDYNSNVATNNDERWFIGNVTLRDLTGCNGLVVKDWMERHQISIDDHNQKYGLGQYHNKRHKNTNVSDVISWQ